MIFEKVTAILAEQLDAETEAITMETNLVKRIRLIFSYDWTEEEALLVHSGSVDVQAPGGGKSVHLVVSSTDSLDGFLSLHSGETAIPYPGGGRWW